MQRKSLYRSHHFTNLVGGGKMPRKQQGWITFQSSEEERKILEDYCQTSQRSKTEILRELVRSLQHKISSNIPVNLGMLESESFNIEEKDRSMKVSARNAMKGTVKALQIGAVNAEVSVEVSPGVEVVSIITKTSAEQLGLTPGKEVYAVIKSSDVMIAVD